VPRKGGVDPILVPPGAQPHLRKPGARPRLGLPRRTGSGGGGVERKKIKLRFGVFGTEIAPPVAEIRASSPISGGGGWPPPTEFFVRRFIPTDPAVGFAVRPVAAEMPGVCTLNKGGG
jgi:hypothetical protein